MMNANHIKNLIRHTGLFALLCLVVTNPVHAAKYARPDATGTTNGWTAVNPPEAPALSPGQPMQMEMA